MNPMDEAMLASVGRCHPTIANPEDTPESQRTPYRENLFLFSFGACGTIHIGVWARPDHIDTALEIAMDCLADIAPGMFVSIDIDAAAEEYDGGGVAWENRSEADQSAIVDLAERDLTVVSHTTYGPGMDAIPSWEWAVWELDPKGYPATWYALAQRSQWERDLEWEGDE